MTELAESLGFDLTDTFTGNVEFLAHLFQGSGSSVIQAKTQAKHLLFSFRQRTQNLVQLFL